MNQLLTHESKSIDTAMQSLKKATNWLSSFIESYSPPLDGERYLTDKELSEFLKLSRRTLQEYRKRKASCPTLYYVAKPSIRNPRYKHFSLVITASR